MNDKKEFKRGFILFSLGGVGLACMMAYFMLTRRMKNLPPTKTLQLDTDSNAIAESGSLFDMKLPIGLTPNQVATMKANRAQFGRGVERAMKGTADEHFLPYQAQFGSRTFRVLTQFAFAYHLNSIIESILSASTALVREHQVTSIRPVLIGSSGGGCGSALITLLTYLINNNDLRWRLSVGLNDYLLEPVQVYVVDPFTHINNNVFLHGARIGANAAAFHVECEMLQEAFKNEKSAFNVILHFGLTSRNGVVASEIEDVARIVSNALIYQQMTSLKLSARGTDLYEYRKLTDKYSGTDGSTLGLTQNFVNPFMGPCLFKCDK